MVKTERSPKSPVLGPLHDAKIAPTLESWATFLPPRLREWFLGDEPFANTTGAITFMLAKERMTARSSVQWCVVPAWPKEVPEWVAMILTFRFW